jgi:D-alanyl-D-alanine dipeptidase
MPDRNEVHTLLESGFLSWADLATVAVTDNGEPLVPLPESLAGASSAAGKTDSMAAMIRRQQDHTGSTIHVRTTLVALLARAQEALGWMLPGGRLEIVFGYRHPAIQEEAYERVRAEILARTPDLADSDLQEAVHRWVAVPDVAGHPTGGAVDVRILAADGTPLDMGTPIGEFVPESYAHSPCIGKAAFHHRQLLRAAMIRAGFAPFDGEWWHFSYGDREWARYFNQPAAIYAPLRVPS